MKWKVYLLLLLIASTAQAQDVFLQEERIRKETRVLYDAADAQCPEQFKYGSNLNATQEFWTVCNLGGGDRIIKIEWYKHESLNSFTFREIYFEKAGDLIYAKESEDFYMKNQLEAKSWNCEFFTQNGDLLTTMSLGHGKTEMEDWDPEVIFEMYQGRLTELEKLKIAND